MAQLRFHNTRTGQKEEFEPIEPGRVRMYACGPTVYDRAHIGNARQAVVFDVLFRLLRNLHGEGVLYVRNITDVDDKINARALELWNSDGAQSLADVVRVITNETIEWYREDMGALSVLTPDLEPRATEFIPEMIELILRLLEGGFAYVAEGHVLFSVDAYSAYGDFSRRSPEDMEAGARVEIAPYKRNPVDFVLWKPSDSNEPGWDSPWGRGRPGWHIECSAMSLKLLGNNFDIHAGGADLIFPHHENEIAQSICANPGSEFARYWMHNGLLTVNGRKMSKSLGNVITIKDLTNKGISGGAIRLTLLSTHYRQSLDWTERKLEENTRAMERWTGMMEDAPDRTGAVSPEIVEALSDDLNTPRAIAEVHRLAKEGDFGSLKASVELLGLLPGESGTGQVQVDDSTQNLIERLLQERAGARGRRHFGEADRIRDLLLSAGVEIKDGPQGTEWSATSRFNPDRLEPDNPGESANVGGFADEG